MTDCCPTCGRAYPIPIAVGGRRRQDVYDYIARHPEGVTIQQVCDYVYQLDPDGGPGNAEVTIRTTIWFLNQKLKPHGLRVRATGGHGSKYKMESA